MMSNIAIVGAGSYGTALARVLSDRGYSIGLYVRETDVHHAILDHGINAHFLPNVRLDTNLVRPTTELAEAVRGADFVFLAVPAPWVRSTLIGLEGLIEPNAVLVLTSKGLEKSGKTMAQLAAEILPSVTLCGLYGITFARAISVGQRLASMCVASHDLQVASAVADLFLHNRRKHRSATKPPGEFRIYLSTDHTGAELGGALKNAYSIAMGVIDQYLESTAKAAIQEPPRPRSSRYALMNLCMLELVSFGLEQGAQLDTLMGPSGIGDFAACVSTDPRAVQSRNYDYGRWKAKSELEKGYRTGAPESHEGHDTVLGAFRLLAASNKSRFPILIAVYDVLFEAKKVAEVMPRLLRELSGRAHYVVSSRAARSSTRLQKPETTTETFKNNARCVCLIPVLA
jgi:glycerol-3-phosphate dehydrogenase (NAD(P)+)